MPVVRATVRRGPRAGTAPGVLPAQLPPAGLRGPPAGGRSRLGPAEVILDRAQLDELHDRLYELESAIDDVERDLAGNPPAGAYEEAVEWLLTVARPLTRLLDRT